MKPRARWTEIEISISKNGQFECYERINALVFGPWAVHRDRDIWHQRYTITHAPSGLRMGIAYNMYDVLTIIQELSCVNGIAESCDEVTDPMVRQHIQPVCERLYRAGFLINWRDA